MGVNPAICNSASSDKNYIALTADVPPAIPEFCNNANNLLTGAGPGEDKTVGDPSHPIQLYRKSLLPYPVSQFRLLPWGGDESRFLFFTFPE
jgi:hypothetical protein